MLLAAVRIRRERGEDAALASSLNNLGVIYVDRGDHEHAKQIFTENLARDRAAKDLWGATCTTLNLAVAHLLAMEPDEAEPLLHELPDGVRRARPTSTCLIGMLEAVAGLAATRGQWVAGARIAAAATQARAVLDVPAAPVDLIACRTVGRGVRRSPVRCRGAAPPVRRAPR